MGGSTRREGEAMCASLSGNVEGENSLLGEVMNLGDDGVYHPDPSRRWQNRRIRESESAGRRAAGKASERSYEIARRRRSEKLAGCLAGMLERRSSLLESMSQNWLYRSWREQFDNIALTSPGAEQDLTQLIRDVQRRITLYVGGPSHLDPPEWWANVMGREISTSTLPPSRAMAEDTAEVWTSPLGAERRAKEEKTRAALERNASDLTSLVSSLEVLLSDVRLYAHYRDLPLETYLSM